MDNPLTLPGLSSTPPESQCTNGSRRRVSLSEYPAATRTRKSHRSGAIGTTPFRKRWIACGSTTSTSWSRCPVPRKKKRSSAHASFFKQKVDGRFKAKLVVQGYVQEAGVDYGRSYAPVCRIGSIRTVLAIACEHEWPVWQMDVVVAFLQAHIDKDVYVKPAPGHDPRDPKTGEVMVYKLERSLYGLAQSPVLWYDTIDGVLIVIGFSPTHSDPCVYVHGSGDTLIDSTGALSVAGNSMFSARTKHIALRYFFVRELVKKNKITLHYTPTKQMLADIATKHLSKHVFRDLLQQIKNFTS